MATMISRPVFEEPRRIVGLGRYRFGDIAADFRGVKGRSNLDVFDAIATNINVHETGDGLVSRDIPSPKSDNSDFMWGTAATSGSIFPCRTTDHDECGANVSAPSGH